MPRNITDEDVEAIAAAVVRRTVPVAASPLPHKLTVAEFAWCVERSAYTIRERRRTDRGFRKHCEGARAVKIHPAALALYGVDSGLAAARLRQFPGTSRALSSDKAGPRPA
jgi:hypothetical protein